MDEYLPVEPLRLGWVLVAVGALVLAHELGFQLGRRRRTLLGGEQEAHAAVILAAVLGLMAFFLGFAFNIAEREFQSRRELVLEEANAIGTTFLRARYLPAPHAERVQVLLSEYVTVRLQAQDLDALESLLSETGRLHRSLWAEAEAVQAAAPLSEGVGLFIDSLNSLIDLHTSRYVTVLYYRLPPAVVWALNGIALLALFLTGHAGARVGRRRWVPPLVLAVSVGIILALIQELDRPSQRLVSVSQKALLDTRDNIAAYLDDRGSE